MRVLLISPLPGLDPAGGDITYTNLLLAHAPEGVEYTTYREALEDGTLVEHGVRRALKRAGRDVWKRSGECALTVGAHFINRMRKMRWLFWEPFRFFSVKPGAYDLVHTHVFNARFFGLDCPLVLSNAAPLRSLYLNARNYSPSRLRAIEGAEISMARVLGINLTSYYLPQVKRLITCTEFLREWYASRGIMQEEQIDTVPIYLPTVEGEMAARWPKLIGFIAKEFEMKGGNVLLEAFYAVKQKRADAELIIVGSEPRMGLEEMKLRGITWIPYVQRELLLKEILPSLDIFAYPTPFDGQPLVVLEAMAAGVAVATSDYQGVPELVDFGRAGLVSAVGSVEGLAANILRLLEPEENWKFRCAGKKRFEEVYSANAARPKLLASYRKALGIAEGGDNLVSEREDAAGAKLTGVQA